MRGLVAVELERTHRLVSRLERPLEIETDIQRPVEEIRVVFCGAQLADALESARHLGCDGTRIAENDLVPALCDRTQRRADEGVQALEVALARRGTGEDHGERFGGIL